MQSWIFIGKNKPKKQPNKNQTKKQQQQKTPTEFPRCLSLPDSENDMASPYIYFKETL